MKICLHCYDARWVCEAHPDMPWIDGPRGCSCGALGEPCPICNKAAAERVPEGFEIFLSLDAGDQTSV